MAGLEGTIKTPVGTVQKKTALYIGGAAVAIGGIVYWREKKMNTVTATTTDTTGDQTLGLVDPATGFVYGTAEDTAALADQGGSLGSVGGVTNTGGGGGIPSGGVGNAYTTNGQWSQAAIEYMINNGLVADQTQLAAALGAYLTGAFVDPSGPFPNLIDQAIAVQGYPPIAGPNGKPPAINTQPASTPTPIGAPTDPVKVHLPTARPAKPHSINIGTTSITMGTSAVSGAAKYAWYVDGRYHDASKGPSYTFKGLHTKTTYTYSVAAQNSANDIGLMSDAVAIRTK